MRASRARARKRRRGAVFVVAATVWHGRRNDAATAIFVGAAVGRPRSAKEILVLPFVVLLLKKRATDGRPYRTKRGESRSDVEPLGCFWARRATGGAPTGHDETDVVRHCLVLDRTDGTGHPCGEEELFSSGIETARARSSRLQRF